MQLKALLLAVVVYVLPALAGNPIITNIYTADPSARVFNDTLYIYPGHDRDQAEWWNIVDWHVFSTTGMANFKDHGVALSLDDLTWAEKYAWAPDCVEINGKYYFYFATDQEKIGVAVGDKPWGPFKDPLGKPLMTRQSPGVVNNRDFIDPCVFIDDDGSAYLFVGQNFLNAVKLNDDMISYTDSITIIEGTEDDFFEAVWVHKNNGKYYMPYSGRGKILYAISDNVFGPYEYKGEILDEVNSDTNHHSIVEYMGRWYLFYHNVDLALKNIPPDSKERKYVQWRRSVCVEHLNYNADGTIQMVRQTKEGMAEIGK